MDKVEILFAPWAIRYLKNVRGPRWKKLVEEIAVLPETHPDSLAFQLMMVRLNSCVTCDAKKYAERGGCAKSSITSLSLSKESDEALIARYRAAKKEIAQTLKSQKRIMSNAA